MERKGWIGEERSRGRRAAGPRAQRNQGLERQGESRWPRGQRWSRRKGESISYNILGAREVDEVAGKL